MTDNLTSNVNGGIIKETFPHPRGGTATIGVWSGGLWQPEDSLLVCQFRDEIFVGTWQIVRVGKMTGREAVFVFTPHNTAHHLPLAKNDILIFGKGGFTKLPVIDTDLPIKTDRAIQFGLPHYPGIALVAQERVIEIIVFHEDGITIELSSRPLVWWRQKPYSLHVALPEKESATV